MATVDLQFKFPDLAGIVVERQAEIRQFIAAQIQTNRGELFEYEGATNGRPRWAPLRMRNGQILARRGALKQSIAPRNTNGAPGPGGYVNFGDDDIVVGTRLFYAAMMNWGTTGLPGGILRPRYAQALKIPLPPGTRRKEEQRIQTARQGLLGQADARKRRAYEEEIAAAQQRLAEAKTTASRRRREAALEKLEKRIAAARAQQDADLAERLGARHRRVAGSRGDFIFRKWVRIPARRFDEWNERDQAELDDALTAKLAEVLNDE